MSFVPLRSSLNSRQALLQASSQGRILWHPTRTNISSSSRPIFRAYSTSNTRTSQLFSFKTTTYINAISISCFLVYAARLYLDEDAGHERILNPFPYLRQFFEFAKSGNIPANDPSKSNLWNEPTPRFRSLLPTSGILKSDIDPKERVRLRDEVLERYFKLKSDNWLHPSVLLHSIGHDSLYHWAFDSLLLWELRAVPLSPVPGALFIAGSIGSGVALWLSRNSNNGNRFPAAACGSSALIAGLMGGRMAAFPLSQTPPIPVLGMSIPVLFWYPVVMLLYNGTFGENGYRSESQEGRYIPFLSNLQSGGFIGGWAIMKLILFRARRGF